MKTVLLLTFQLSWASLILGDFLQTQTGPPASRIASIEVDFSGSFYQTCGSYDVWVKLKTGYRNCYVYLGDPEDGEIVRKDLRNSGSIRDCQLEFDDGNSLPKFQIYSNRNNKFCLAHIKMRTQNEQSFYFDFNGFYDTETLPNIPLATRRSLSSNAQQISNLHCPTSGCPIADVFAYDTEVPSRYYCSVNSNCNYVTSTGLHDADNGFVCTESAGYYGLPKYCCQSGEHQGIDHCDDVIPRNNPPRNNPPRNNRTTESARTHGPFGTGPYINGGLVGGSPFTAIGPFAKISIKTMPYNQGLIVKGIKTESNDGTVQTFGMHQYETAGVRELVVPQGEHISGVKLRYGWFIDQLGFVTNTNRRLGRVGRRSGGSSETVPRNFDSGRTLIRIEGELVNWSGTEIMTKLKFTFADQNQRGGDQNSGGQRRNGQNGGRQNGGQNGNGYQSHFNY
jgi:hypothetical protein